MYTSALFKRVSEEPTVCTLLKWVTEGHLEEAEKLLKGNPLLAEAKGTITDLSGRTFENVTAFQLAVWYLDDEMWEIILKYLSKPQAALQLDILEYEGEDIYQNYGKHFNLDFLIKEYQIYLANYKNWNDDQRKEQWCKKVGSEQRKLPAWLIYAFCEEGKNTAWLRQDFVVRKPQRQYYKKHVVDPYRKRCNVDGNYVYSPGYIGKEFAYVRNALKGSPDNSPDHGIDYLGYINFACWGLESDVEDGYLESIEIDYQNFQNLKSRQIEQLSKLQDKLQIRQARFLKCLVLQRGHEQVNSSISQLPQDILNKIYHYILPTTPILAKMTEISAKVFHQTYTSSMFSEESAEANLLNKGLETALSAKTLIEKAERIKAITEQFLQKELGTHEKGKFAHSPTVALLCKYHLIADNEVIADPSRSEHFQLNEHQLKKPRKPFAKLKNLPNPLMMLTPN